MARWAHGLSAVEPRRVEKESHPQHSRDSSLSSEENSAYSPVSNFLLTRELPVAVDSCHAVKEMEVHFESQWSEASREDQRPVESHVDSDVEPDDLIH